jgi:hypothetical protein
MKTRHITMVLALVLTGITLLSGCGSGIITLPDGERYQYVNEVKNAVELETSGEIVEGYYDNGDGVFSPSTYRAVVKGENSFDTLVTRVEELPGTDCRDAQPIQLKCTFNHVSISVTRESENSNVVRFSVIDTYNGREPE